MSSRPQAISGSSPTRLLSSRPGGSDRWVLEERGNPISHTQKMKTTAGRPPPGAAACSPRQRCRYLVWSEAARHPLMRFDRHGDDPLA
jgi:hypothetical protein